MEVSRLSGSRRRCEVVVMAVDANGRVDIVETSIKVVDIEREGLGQATVAAGTHRCLGKYNNSSEGTTIRPSGDTPRCSYSVTLIRRSANCGLDVERVVDSAFT